MTATCKLLMPRLVFCCPALPVVLSVGRISNTLGIPYAFCKGRRITPSYSCGRGLGTHVDMPAEQGRAAQTAVETLRYAVVKLNLERKKKRLAEKKRKRALHDLKRFPRIFLMCDSASAAWLLRQLEPNRTVQPPMGSDVYPENPEDNPLACAMMQAMMTPMYKTILMSATLPRPAALPTLVKSFMERFKIPESKRDLHIVANVSRAAKEAFEDLPVLFGTLGNSDSREDYYQELTDNESSNPWFEKLGSAIHSQGGMKPEVLEQFTYGSYYETREGQLTILSLATVIYSFRWLRQRLQLAAADGRHVWIVGHISPGIETFAYTELWYPQYVEAYLEIVQDCR
eukprot:g30876.t1